MLRKNVCLNYLTRCATLFEVIKKHDGLESYRTLLYGSNYRFLYFPMFEYYVFRSDCISVSAQYNR